jgi:poly-beta-1,6-N-acetyl-D-glucosamine synthase
LKDEEMMSKSQYVLITACRNESAFIDGLIETIAEQTLQPLLWLIVDDSSTDGTYVKAKEGANRLLYLHVTRIPHGRSRSFASQVYAQQTGYKLIRELDFEFVGFLDADIRIEKNYYFKMIQHFKANSKLGIVGGVILEKIKNRLENRRAGSEEFHVAGGIQFFRRECFEQIGGYIPIDGGGQDTIADIKAMMYGWTIKTVHEAKAVHLRPDGFSKQNVFRWGIAWGRKFQLIGYHPLFYFGQCLRRINYRPIVVRSLCQLLGFIIASLKAEPRSVSEDFVRFLRKQQLRRMRNVLKNFQIY